MRCSRPYRFSSIFVGLLITLAARMPVQAAVPGAFEPVGPMTEPRNGPAAALLQDGRVLVTGGRAWDGRGSLVPLASAELFDPATHTFEPLPLPLRESRWLHTATRLQDGRVLIVGGFTGTQGFYRELASAELFDPATGESSMAGRLSQARAGHTATLLLDGRVLVVGGEDLNGSVKSAELFDPASGEFQATGPPVGGRSDHSAVLLADGRVVILGGGRGDGRPLLQVEVYDPASGLFAVRGELSEERHFAVATCLPDGRILVAGGSRWDGSDPAALSSIEIYDPAIGVSAIEGALNVRRSHLHRQTAVLADGRVLLPGGWSSVGGPWVPLQTAALIDPVTGEASPTASMSEPRAEAAAVRLRDGRVLVLGGFTSNLVVLNSAEVYVPSPAAPTRP